MPEMITNVPGFEPTPEQEQPEDPRKVIRIPADQFRGDPSRVLGHPSNPNTEAQAAYAERLTEQAQEMASTGEEHASGNEHIITHVPSAEELQQKSL